MPELPDVESFRRYVDATCLHQTIDDVTLPDAALLAGVSRRRLAQTLPGTQFEKTARHGKHLAVHLAEGHWLLLHFGMTGSLKYYQDAEQEPEHTRLLIRFDNGYHLAYINQRKLGRIRLVDNFTEFTKREQLGPDAAEISRATFRQLVIGGRGTIKTRLMNQNIVAGLGNVYVDEILYHAGYHPASKTSQLNAADANALHRTMRRVLATAIKHRGVPGDMPASWLLPQRDGDGQCPRGHGKLETTKVSGRTTYFCPACQPKKT